MQGDHRATTRPRASLRPSIETRTLHLITDTRRRGAQVFAADLRKRLVDEGIDGDLVALRGGGALGVDEILRGGGARRAAAVLRRTRSVRVTVAHGSTTLPYSAISCASPLGFVYRSIGDVTHWSRGRARSVRTGLLMRRARRVVALWPGAVEGLVALGIDPDRIDVIPNGVPAERYGPAQPGEAADVRARYSIPESALVVAGVGALAPEKQWDRLVEAVATIDGAFVVLAGGGPDGPRLRALSERLCPKRALVLGAIEDVRPVLVAADVVALPSRTEGIPAVPVEAAFVGRPVVASDVGGVSAVVRGGETGFLVPPDGIDVLASAIESAASAPPSLVEAARRHCIERFEIGVVAERWATMLRRLT